MVGGDRVEVQVLMPPGASPHGYEPGPDAIRALSNAEIVFVVGRNLDGWAENLARGANPKIRIERIGTGLDTAEPPSAPEDPEGDPHVWLDPLKASAMAGRIGETLAALRPADADSIDARARRAMQQIAALDLYCQKALDPVHEIPFVALHGGLNHLVARYQLAQIAIIEIFPDHEPSPRYLKQVISSIRNTNARAVIAEPQLSAQLAEVVAGEAHVPVVEIDAIGGVPGNMTYEELIHTVVDALVRALGEKQ
jgi:ABC-type Zn uptake system ZnuABC Zn-binding protein ZnuA